MEPTNDIERILDSKRFGPQDYPALFRLLLESDLVFLIPIWTAAPHLIHWGEHDGRPPFGRIRRREQGKTEERTPIFSSTDAARRACRASGLWKQFTLCQMNGQKLFEWLAQEDGMFVVNPSSTRNELHMDLAAVRKLADGSLLTQRPREHVEGTLKLLDPAEYPTDFMQAIFEFLRKNSSVQAAWIFKYLDGAGNLCYVFILDAPSNPKEVEDEFSLIARLACPKGAEWGVRFLDRNDSEMARIPQEFAPFYRAAS
jgi:hypothetical protein